MSNPDEAAALPAAVDSLYRAVGDLVDPVKELVQGRVLVAPSAYEQLIREIPATRSGDSFSRGVGRSLPPVWCDAVDLRVRIDTRAKQMHPEGDSTPGRLRGLASRRWRPQDTRRVAEHATEIESWTISVQSLLSPEHVKHITAPCPSCGKRWVYRNHAGENVRQAALQLVVHAGCTCQGCGASWTPDRYLWLCKLLGFDIPACVLE